MRISDRLKTTQLRRLTLGLFSIFILWHIIGISLVGPAHSGYLHNTLMKVYGPYLSVLHLDRSWPFYAPDPFAGSILRYEAIDSNGNSKTYPLTEAREKFNHAYFRYTNFYAYLFSNPAYSHERGYDRSVARFLCSQHRESHATAINFILLNQKPFSYQDYRLGKNPLSDEFLDKTEFGPYKCIKRNSS